MKHPAIRLMPLLFVPFITACNGGTVMLLDSTTHIMSTLNMRSTDISFSSQKSNGDTIYKIVVNEKRALNVACEFKVTLGSITMSMTTMEDEEFFSEIIIEDTNFDIPLKEYASYKIKIHYDDFRGSYRLNWAK